MHHTFDINIAEEYGVNIAIFLNHLAFWIRKNQANNKHFHDGRYWTYNSVQAYSDLFPYWTQKQMRVVLEKVKESGLVMTGNYNGTAYDRTQWYSLSDKGHQLVGLTICPFGQIEELERANGFAKKGQPIPDIKPDIKQEKRESAKKRAPLISLCDFKPSKESKALLNETSERCGITVNDLQAKFFALYEAEKKADWDKQLKIFLVREKPSYKKPSASSSKETRSTVKEWGPGHPSYDSIYGTTQ